MAIQVAARPVVPATADDVVVPRAARSAPGAGAAVVAEVPGQVVRIQGRLDVRSVPDVRAALHAAVDAGSADLLVHVDAVVGADATGLGVFLGAHRRAQRRGRRLVLREVPLPTMRLLRVTRLHRVLEVEGALASPSPALRRERTEALLRAPDRPLTRDDATRDDTTRADATRDDAAQNNRVVTSSMPRRAS